jgi:hypothetical protein
MAHVNNIAFWKTAGLSFTKYSIVSAQVVRSAVRPDIAKQAKFEERDGERLQFRVWKEGKAQPKTDMPQFFTQ